MNDWINAFLWGKPGSDANFEADVRSGGLQAGWDGMQPTGGMLGRTLPDGTQLSGWGAPVFGAVKGIADVWGGMRQYGLAKDALRENKRQFNLNWDLNRNMVNSQLEDRQRARVASNPGAYQPVDEYMSTYRVR
jgi:hypothetical protein